MMTTSSRSSKRSKPTEANKESKNKSGYSLGARGIIISLLHISPAHNQDFGVVTSPDLHRIDTTVTRVWRKLVRLPGRFIGEYTENIFGSFRIECHPELAD